MWYLCFHDYLNALTYTREAIGVQLVALPAGTLKASMREI